MNYITQIYKHIRKKIYKTLKYLTYTPYYHTILCTVQYTLGWLEVWKNIISIPPPPSFPNYSFVQCKGGTTRWISNRFFVSNQFLKIIISWKKKIIFRDTLMYVYTYRARIYDTVQSLNGNTVRTEQNTDYCMHEHDIEGIWTWYRYLHIVYYILYILCSSSI